MSLATLADDVIIDSCRLLSFRILIVTKEKKKADKVKDEIWTRIRNYNIDKKYVKEVTPTEHGYNIVFKNDSCVIITSLGVAKSLKGVRVDQIYYFKGDELTGKDKDKVLSPLINTEGPRIQSKERLLEI